MSGTDKHLDYLKRLAADLRRTRRRLSELEGKLSQPVAAGDDLVLLVSGQGYDSAAPTVSSVSDPVNGQWSALVNDKFGEGQ